MDFPYICDIAGEITLELLIRVFKVLKGICTVFQLYLERQSEQTCDMFLNLGIGFIYNKLIAYKCFVYAYCTPFYFKF